MVTKQTQPVASSVPLNIIDAHTHTELVLIKSGGFYRVGNDVVIGDLYRNPAAPEHSILVKTRTISLEDPEVAILNATQTKNGA